MLRSILALTFAAAMIIPLLATPPQAPTGLGTPTAPAPSTVQPLTPEMRGDIMMARKQYREAVDLYRIGGADKSPILSNKTGIAFHQLLDLSNAQKYYEKAIKLNPKYSEAINNLGTVYYAKKSYRRAVEQYKKALRLAPFSASVLSNLGTAYFARKNFEEALLAYQQALAIDPEVFEHHGANGTVLQERSVEDRAKFHLYMSKTYAKAGIPDRALLYLRRSLEEGYKEKDKILKDPDFATLLENEEFKQIMAAEQKVL